MSVSSSSQLPLWVDSRLSTPWVARPPGIKHTKVCIQENLAFPFYETSLPTVNPKKAPNLKFPGGLLLPLRQRFSPCHRSFELLWSRPPPGGGGPIEPPRRAGV